MRRSKMMTNPDRRVPVSERALIARLNRKLAEDDWMVKVARPGSRLENNVGRYYALDYRLNAVMHTHLDLETFAADKGCLAAYERLETS